MATQTTHTSGADRIRGKDREELAQELRRRVSLHHPSTRPWPPEAQACLGYNGFFAGGHDTWKHRLTFLSGSTRWR